MLLQPQIMSMTRVIIELHVMCEFITLIWYYVIVIRFGGSK